MYGLSVKPNLRPLVVSRLLVVCCLTYCTAVAALAGANAFAEEEEARKVRMAAEDASRDDDEEAAFETARGDEAMEPASDDHVSGTTEPLVVEAVLSLLFLAQFIQGTSYRR